MVADDGVTSVTAPVVASRHGPASAEAGAASSASTAASRVRVRPTAGTLEAACGRIATTRRPRRSPTSARRPCCGSCGRTSATRPSRTGPAGPPAPGWSGARAAASARHARARRGLHRRRLRGRQPGGARPPRGGRARIVASPVEHPAVREPLPLARRPTRSPGRRSSADGRVELDGLAELVRPGDALCCRVGQQRDRLVQPVAAIAELCAARGVPLHLDAVQAAAACRSTWARCRASHRGRRRAQARRAEGQRPARRPRRRPLAAVLHGGGQERGLRPGTESAALAAGLAPALAESQAARLVDAAGAARRLRGWRCSSRSTTCRSPRAAPSACRVTAWPWSAASAGTRSWRCSTSRASRPPRARPAPAARPSRATSWPRWACRGERALGALRVHLRLAQRAGPSGRDRRRRWPRRSPALRRPPRRWHEPRGRRPARAGALERARRRGTGRRQRLRRPRPAHPARSTRGRIAAAALRRAAAARRRPPPPPGARAAPRVPRSSTPPGSRSPTASRSAGSPSAGASAPPSPSTRCTPRSATRSARCARPGPGRVAVAMSGGVDSAVALLRLRDARHAAVGLTLRLWIDPRRAHVERACCSPEAVRRARATCHALGVPHVTLDGRDAFRRTVVEPFVAGYAGRRDPEPVHRLQRRLPARRRWPPPPRARRRALATGHYARIVARDGALVAPRRRPRKDQSYMLATRAARAARPAAVPARPTRTSRRCGPRPRLPASLRRARPRARTCASSAAATCAGSSSARASPRRGDDRAEDGAVLGRHAGAVGFTPGQRRGLGVAAPEPLYVRSVDPARGSSVGRSRRLARREVMLRRRHAASPRRPRRGRAARALAGVGARSSRPTDGLRLRLDEPAYGVAPGQTAVLYDDGGAVVGAGTIARAREAAARSATEFEHRELQRRALEAGRPYLVFLRSDSFELGLYGAPAPTTASSRTTRTRSTSSSPVAGASSSTVPMLPSAPERCCSSRSTSCTAPTRSRKTSRSWSRSRRRGRAEHGLGRCPAHRSELLPRRHGPDALVRPDPRRSHARSRLPCDRPDRGRGTARCSARPATRSTRSRASSTTPSGSPGLRPMRSMPPSAAPAPWSRVSRSRSPRSRVRCPPSTGPCAGSYGARTTEELPASLERCTSSRSYAHRPIPVSGRFSSGPGVQEGPRAESPDATAFVPLPTPEEQP